MAAGEMELVGIAVHGGRNGVDRALKGLTLHPEHARAYDRMGIW